ncbi:dTDP-4-dehydrorhamnose reductase [Vibrio algarum]|uniref:dTDP-4-dehydrorhamnose reductase n=1 Tax=Vibrio algarum TaxID=3020714 RepID=A0ABT4YLN7_9VIBR|nr:dTDP-4-dehydrorhamnose reductase [Vibrio sp. KJ40-1]MDB1122438.1 dTDP-4-dehydrorhamnose reductase [Vibrio sp. KJ40-1]
MKVLITGCNGQVGKCLTKNLAENAEILAVDYQDLDITDQAAVFNVFLDFQPDYIVNAAAHTAVDRAEEEVDLSFKVNRDGPKFLAEAAQACGAVILHISTDYVFGGEGSGLYTESDKTDPQCVYGESKLAGEAAVVENCENHLILRTAWVFGEHGNNFVKTMLKLAETRDALSIVGDQFGGPTYAKDISDALVKMIESIEAGKQPEWGVYHFSGLPHVSWFEFAEYIFNTAHKEGILDTIPQLTSIPTSSYPTPAKRPENSRLDCQKIENQFQIKPSDWQAALTNIQAYK